MSEDAPTFNFSKTNPLSPVAQQWMSCLGCIVLPLVLGLIAAGVWYFMNQDSSSGPTKEAVPSSSDNDLPLVPSAPRSSVVTADPAAPVPAPEPVEPVEPEIPDKPKKTIIWRPVFMDDFDRRELGAHWQILDGEWILKDGKLVISKQDPQSVIVCTKADFSGDVQVSYRCRTLSSYNGQACDMSLFTHIPEKQLNGWNEGYLWRFGSYDNRWSGLTRLGRDIIRNPRVRIKPQKVHTVVIRKLGSQLTLLVDGEVVVNYHDANPLGHENRTWGGFYVYRSVVEFDSLTISKPFEIDIPDPPQPRDKGGPDPAPGPDPEADQGVF